MSFRLASSSFFIGHSTGGRSGEMLMASGWSRNCLAFPSHELLVLRSRNLIIMPLPACLLRRWQAAKSVVAASEISRWSLASLTQASLVTSSSSPASPFRPNWDRNLWRNRMSSIEYHREHWHRNQKSGSKAVLPEPYRGNSYGCIRHYPIWTSSSSLVPGHPIDTYQHYRRWGKSSCCGFSA